MIVLAFVMFSVSAAEFFAGRKAGGNPVAATVFHKQEGLFPIDIAFYSSADNWTRFGKILQNLLMLTTSVSQFTKLLLNYTINR